MQSAAKYLAAAKRGKTFNRQQPRGKHGAEHGSHSTVAKRAETRVNKYTFSFGFLLCMGFVLQHRCHFTRSLEGRVAFERSVVLLLRSMSLIIIKQRLCFRSYELAPSVEAVKASCNLHSREVPNTVIASGFSGRAVTQEEATRKVQRVIVTFNRVSAHSYVSIVTHLDFSNSSMCGWESFCEGQTGNILNTGTGL